MARPKRIEIPGGIYYVTSQGMGRSPVVRGDGDSYVWFEVLERTLSRYGWRCHGWCLLEGGYHLLVETPEANLSLGMRQLNGVYTQRFNAKYGKKGQVFHGRFKSLLTERGEALLGVVGFMAACPVNAGLAKHPQEYEWSSYAELTGRRTAKKWLEQSLVLGLVGKSRKWSREELIAMVEGHEGEFTPPHSLAVAQQFLGSTEFVGRMREYGANVSSRETGRQGSGPTLEELFRPMPKARVERDRRIAKAYQSGFTLAQIAKAVGLHYGHVSKIIKREEKARTSDTPLLLLMD